MILKYLIFPPKEDPLQRRAGLPAGRQAPSAEKFI